MVVFMIFSSEVSTLGLFPYITNLLTVKLCVIRAAAGYPVFGLFPGLFKEILKSPLHVCLVCSVIIFQLLAQLTHCGRMQIGFYIGIARLSDHLMRNLMDIQTYQVKLTANRRWNVNHFNYNGLLPQRDGCTL